MAAYVRNNVKFEDERSICKIWDTEKNEFWATPRGKTEWRLPTHAKNAVLANPPNFMMYSNGQYSNSYLKFSEQNRLIVVRAYYLLDHIEDVE